jgi:hypothetical protein
MAEPRLESANTNNPVETSTQPENARLEFLMSGNGSR